MNGQALIDTAKALAFAEPKVGFDPLAKSIMAAQILSVGRCAGRREVDF
jgi:hypothetical protein